MKKVFTVDGIFAAFISAIGYGLGYAVPEALGAGVVLSTVCCFVLGMLFEAIGEKLVYNKYTQENNTRRIIVFVIIAVLFITMYGFGMKALDHSLFEDLEEELFYVIVIPVLGFVFSLVLNALKVRILKSRYGDGSSGFTVNDEARKYMDEQNARNREITEEYDSKFAATTANGIFVPEKSRKVLAYLGIPYAKVPVGELRFRAPQPPENSVKVYEATHYGPSALQLNVDGNALRYHIQSEDCLYLNVWTAREKRDEGDMPKPVIVYFHGGDLRYGGSAHPLYSGANFVENNQDTVFVSFNYRLGPMGFLSADFLPDAEDYPDAGNLGLLDQIAALKWVKENISSFGGDPDNITAMGDGAGAASIVLLSVCEAARGLFRKAVLLSGSIRELNAAQDENARISAEEFLSHFGAKSMDDMMKIREQELAEYIQNGTQICCVPKRDGILIPENVEKAFAEGKTGDIRFIFGKAKDEVGVYRSIISPEDYEEWILADMEYAFSLPGDEAEELKSFYAEKERELGKNQAAELTVNKWLFDNGTEVLLDGLCRNGKDARKFDFNLNALIEKLGSGSIIMTSTILGNEDIAEVYGSVVNKDVSNIMQTLLSKFLHNEEVALYRNEIEGVDALNWKPYPGTLNVTDEGFICGDS